MVDFNVGELLCPEVGGGVFIPLQEICPLHRKLAPDISGPSTGYIRPSTGYIRSSDRKFRCGADISAQSSGAPERSICELLASGLSENPAHRIYPAPRPEVPVGADISAQSSGAHDATICELLFKVLSENGEGRIYPGSTPDISGGGRIFPA